MTFNFPKPDLEAQIVEQETNIQAPLAKKLVTLGGNLRALEGHDLEEVPSTRLLVHAASLIMDGLSPAEACRVALVEALSDDPVIQEGVWEIVRSIFPA
jgi:nitric oxide reductase NorQ protein